LGEAELCWVGKDGEPVEYVSCWSHSVLT